MDIKIFKNELFEKAKEAGFEQCEVYYSTRKGIKINIIKSDVEKFDNSTYGVLSFRGIYNGKMGRAYTENIEKESILPLINYAKENAQIKEGSENEEIYQGDSEYTPVVTYYEKLENVQVNSIIEKALHMEKSMLEYDERVKSSDACIISKGYNQRYIANTKGLELTDKSNYIMAYAGSIVKSNDEVKSGAELKICFDIDELNTKEIGNKASEKAIVQLGAKSLKSAKYNIVFENNCFSDLLDCFKGNFYGENVQLGLSLLKGKINKNIANKNVTILDEPLMEQGYNSQSFDDEGVATYNKIVVDRGLLKTYLHNLKTAKKDNVKSTGNASKYGNGGEIKISTTNFYIKNGDKNPSDILKDVQDGIYITDISGLHAGANAVSGDFSLLAEGFCIEDGKKSYPVEQITIAGNFYKILENIQDIANDLEFSPSGVGSPTVFVGKLSVSGE